MVMKRARWRLGFRRRRWPGQARLGGCEDGGYGESGAGDGATSRLPVHDGCSNSGHAEDYGLYRRALAGCCGCDGDLTRAERHGLNACI
jgi:hypothetical protein